MNPWSAAVVIIATLIVALQSLSEGRHFDAESFLSNSLRDPSEDPASSDESSDFDSGNPFSDSMKPFRIKRMLFDSNCKGMYDQKMMRKLDDVCDGCYNLYRKPYIATECRKYCYNNGVFESCLNDLLMHDVADEYRHMVQFLGK